MVNYVIIDALDQIPSLEPDRYKKCPVPLFHGTRERSLSVIKDEQRMFYSCCDTVLKYTKSVLETVDLQEKFDAHQKSIIKKIFDQQWVLTQLYGESKSFEYEAFYVTNIVDLAIDGYSSLNAGGELGELAYKNAVSLPKIGITLPENVAIACESVITEHKKYKNSEQIILVLVNCDWDDLYTEKGFPFLKKHQDETDEEFYEHNREDIEDLENGAQGSFRVHNIEKYTLFAVRKNLFAECKERYTSV